MSTKEWVYCENDIDVGCYQEITFDDVNNNPAVIQIENPSEFSITRSGDYEIAHIGIDAKVFDHLAIAWCVKRGIVNKSASGILKGHKIQKDISEEDSRDSNFD